MKAWNVFPGGHPLDAGCFLVFAPTRGQAIALVHAGRYWFADWTEYRAWRAPEFDCWALRPEPHLVETNDDLPDGAPKFYLDSDDEEEELEL